MAHMQRRNMIETKRILTWVLSLITTLSALHEIHADPYYDQLDECCSPPSCDISRGYFFVRGDVLYWTPRISGLELNFGTSSIAQEDVDGIEVFTTKEVDLDPHFNWNAGFRLGVGYENTFWSKWEIEALWTHFQSHGRKHHCENDNLDFTNTGKIKIKLDQIDVLFACPSNREDLCMLSLKPFLGIRAAKIHEDLHAMLLTHISLSSSSKPLETRKFDDKQNYRGVGPLLGLHGDWETDCGFGFYGTAAVSVLYGDYRMHFDDEDVFSSCISKQILSKTRRHVHVFDCNIDLALGLSWLTCFRKNYNLQAKLGVEHHQFFNQNRLCVGRGDITFTGGIFSLQISF